MTLKTNIPLVHIKYQSQSFHEHVLLTKVYILCALGEQLMPSNARNHAEVSLLVVFYPNFKKKKKQLILFW